MVRMDFSDPRCSDTRSGDNGAMTTNPKPRLALAITQGDLCGIGPEIIARLFRSGDAAGCFVIGDLAVLRRAALQTGGMLAVARIEHPADSFDLPPACIGVLQAEGLAGDLLQVPQGKGDARGGAAAAGRLATTPPPRVR